MPIRHPVTMIIKCVDFPDPAQFPGVELSLIEGKAPQKTTSLEEAFKTGKVDFQCRLEVALNQAEQKALFYGPAAQGGPGERFIYLAWLRKAEAGREMFQRIKLPLAVFPYAYVMECGQKQRSLKVEVRVKDRHSKPAAASLKAEMLQVLD